MDTAKFKAHPCGPTWLPNPRPQHALEGCRSMTTIMATRRLVATIGLVVTFGLGTSSAIWPQDMATAVKSCTVMADDKDRLRCFDRLFSVPGQPQNPQEGAQANWSIEE